MIRTKTYTLKTQSSYSGRLDRKSAFPPLYSKMLRFLFATSFLVFIEPAPYDLLFALLVAAGVISASITFSSCQSIPLAMTVLFINGNLISLLFTAPYLDVSLRFIFITFYLALSWIFLVGLLSRYGWQCTVAIFSGYTIAAVFSACLGLLAYFRALPWPNLFLKSGRVAALFKDPNVYGPFLIPPALLCLSMFESSRRTAIRFRYVLIFTILAAGILVSFSRAAWGNLAFSVLIYFLLPPPNSSARRFQTLVIIGVVALPALWFLATQPNVYQLFIARLGLQQYDQMRFGTQAESLKRAMETPLGIGPGMSMHTFDYSTHSLYIRVLTENGILGFTSLMCLIGFSLVRSIWQALQEHDYRLYARVVTSSLFGVLLNSFVIDTLHWRHFWLLLALPWVPLGGPSHEDHSDSNPLRQHRRSSDSR